MSKTDAMEKRTAKEEHSTKPVRTKYHSALCPVNWGSREQKPARRTSAAQHWNCKEAAKGIASKATNSQETRGRSGHFVTAETGPVANPAAVVAAADGVGEHLVPWEKSEALAAY